MSNPIVTIEMEDGGIIRAELYPGDRAEHRAQLCQSGQEGLL